MVTMFVVSAVINMRWRRRLVYTIIVYERANSTHLMGWLKSPLLNCVIKFSS